MSSLRVVLGDQLSLELSALSGIDRDRDVVLMMEVAEETRYVPHHPQKIALVLSAMRHFAAELRAQGLRVDYVALDDAGNSGSLSGEVLRALQRHRPRRIIATEPGEWRVLEAMRTWSGLARLPVEVRPDGRFFASRERFAGWAKGRRVLRMEYFYRELRRESGLLMDGDQPVGGRWNYDSENRRPLPPDLRPAAPAGFEPDAITRAVLELIRDRHAGHFGALEPFAWPVTRAQALCLLQDFVEQRLPHFGDYQDAMSAETPFVYHSLLAPCLNLGLLSPREVCASVERAWQQGRVPLNAAEGFIRQVLGWREYVRGIYWLKMPDYAGSNHLCARRPLPDFFWGAPTPMRCVATVVEQTRAHAYSHHIQRLMITGNFALLAGLSPAEVEAWYLAVYADAVDWVQLPNTHGMALYADGGLLASKPYAASGAYIRRMSDFCRGCRYDPRQRSGARACPFNFLYWNFLIEHEQILRQHPRLAMPYRQLARWSVEDKEAIVDQAQNFLERLAPAAPH